jgi:hypothetical protein
MTTFIICIFAIFLFSIFFSKSTSKHNIKEEITQQNKIYNLIKNNVSIKSKEYLNNDFTKAIILDETNRKIHFLSTITNNCETFNFDDLIETELIIDNDSVTKTSRGSQLIGSVVGGTIAGVPGMIIGGLSSQKISSERIKNMSIKLTFNDMDNPVYKFNFLNSPSGVCKDSHEYRIAMNYIEKWYGYFIVIIKQHNNASGK